MSGGKGDTRGESHSGEWSEEKEALIADLNKCKERRVDLEKEIHALKREKEKARYAALEGESKKEEAAATLGAATGSAAADSDSGKTSVKVQEVEIHNPTKQKKETPKKKENDSKGGNEADPLREKSMSYFSEDLKSGKLREDEKYGLLYTVNLDKKEADDLTKIKGVGNVLNQTLNDFGVYKYRQIALWTPQICEDFSEKIAFKGRVERDDWISQCKQFHEEKYGEKI